MSEEHLENFLALKEYYQFGDEEGGGSTPRAAAFPAMGQEAVTDRAIRERAAYESKKLLQKETEAAFKEAIT